MDSQKPYWRDDQVVVDRDGIPHYTGARPELMKEYRRRVLFAFSNLEGSGDDEEKEARSLAKKKRRFAKRLMDNLHDEAWRVCQDLLTDEKLKQPDGYKEIFRCLQKIEKVTVLKKTEAFDNFFDKTYRRRGQSVDAFLRQRAESWADLRDLSEGVAMSEDLLAYFLLKNVGLGKDEKRQVLLANQSDYSLAGFEKALRVSFFDIHEREKTKEWGHSGHGGRKGTGKGGGKRHYAHAAEELEHEDYPEDDGEDDGYALATGEMENDDDEDAEEYGYGAATEGESDQGACEDDAVYEAYATYKESRKRLKDLQKSRGFLRNKSAMSVDERKAAVEKEKARSRCAACGRLGHWAGDGVCAKSSKGGPKGGRSSSKGKGSGSNKGQPSKGRAYAVSESPLFFSLRQDDDQDGYCDMVIHDKDGKESEATRMEQDSGATELDGKRKKTAGAMASYADSEGWECVASPFVSEQLPEQLPENDRPTVARQESEEQLVITVPKKDVQIVYVESFQELLGEDLDSKLLRDLQQMCEKWGIQTSGKKDDIKSRLRQLFGGQAVLRKGCTTKYVRLKEQRTTSSMAASSQGPMAFQKATAAAPKQATTPLKAPTAASRQDMASWQASTSAPQPVTTPRQPASAPSAAAASAPMTPKTSRSFRSPGYASPKQATASPQESWKTRSPTTEERHPGPKLDPKTGRKYDPKTDVTIPADVYLNEPCVEIRCGVCGNPMVLRRGFNLFFGCPDYPNCQYTRQLLEGLEMRGGARQG